MNVHISPSFRPQNTSMERMSSYSNNGTGSGANSDTEAYNACTHSSSRAEPAAQVSPHRHHTLWSMFLWIFCCDRPFTPNQYTSAALS